MSNLRRFVAGDLPALHMRSASDLFATIRSAAGGCGIRLSPMPSPGPDLLRHDLLRSIFPDNRCPAQSCPVNCSDGESLPVGLNSHSHAPPPPTGACEG